MAIKEEKVDVMLSSLTINHYTSLGYAIPRRPTRGGKHQVRHGEVITVDVCDLPASSRALLTKICDFCGTEVANQAYGVILRCRKEGKDSCRKCAIKKMSKETIEKRGRSISRAKRLKAATATNNLSIKFPKVAEWWCDLKNELPATSYTPYSGYKAWWVCPKCSHEWKAAIFSRTRGGNGCPSCSMSKGEARIRDYFNANNIPFIPQASVEGLVGLGGGLLLFDFVVVNKDGGWEFAVEYDGIQHFKPKDMDGKGEWFASWEFGKRQIHDLRKTNWCITNSVPLLRIGYMDFDHIESILSEFMVELHRKNDSIA